MHLRDLLTDVDVLEWSGDPGVDVVALAHDSHEVSPGACFACIPGAVALLVERRLGLDVTEARVAAVRPALGPVASRLYGSPSRALRCLGVTGTNGKTTTTYLLEAIANAAGERAGVIGTVGARIAGETVPEERTTPEATPAVDPADSGSLNDSQ